MTCIGCRRSGKSDRLPHGWKRLGEAIYCETCWRERYNLRSIALPVVEPVGEDWAVFREALKDGWTDATAAANWMITELYARDVRRNGEEKMPRMARVYLYPEARLRFPRLAPQTVVSIENNVRPLTVRLATSLCGPAPPACRSIDILCRCRCTTNPGRPPRSPTGPWCGSV